jgi:hypothetical protein
MRPVLKGMCKYVELKDGSLNLYDIMLMNHAIDIEIHYQNIMLKDQYSG